MDIPLGEGTIDVTLPDANVTVAEPPGGDAVDVRAAASAALDRPAGPSLATHARGADDVALVVTDVTRATPDDVLVDLLLDELRAAGIDRERITVVVGLGLHRPLDDAELESLLGEHADLAVNHDPDAAIRVGDVDGVPIEIHPTVATADLVVSTGMVEPHQYAGFSGGAKTVVIGAGGESQIQHSHGPDLLGREGVRLGRIRENPFREFVDRAGQLVGPDFCINVTHGPSESRSEEGEDGRSAILDVEAGNPRAVVDRLVRSARDALSVPVDGAYDVVVTGVGAPKDANLYQASRAATYVALGPQDPLGAAGRLVIPAKLSEGAGRGRGEQRFYERLWGATDADSVYEEMRQGYEPGAQRAFVLAEVLREHDVWVTNSEHPAVVEDCLMTATETVTDAVPAGSDVLVVPDTLNTLLVAPEEAD